MATSARRHKIQVMRRRRVDDARHGYTYVHDIDMGRVWGAISPTLGGGRRERQLFGPTVQFEMNAMGLFHPKTDLKVTDEVTLKGDTYEVLAVVNSLYLNKGKFAALKSIPETPGKPVPVPDPEP